jgi:hypothetical protein
MVVHISWQWKWVILIMNALQAALLFAGEPVRTVVAQDIDWGWYRILQAFESICILLYWTDLYLVSFHQIPIFNGRFSSSSL